MQVHLTFDYELFFGTDSGTAEKCILEPTEFLLGLCEKYGVPMTFFVDAGYLFALQRQQDEPVLVETLERISRQMCRMTDLGCQIGLHIHPHWEQSFYKEGKWDIRTGNAYKLSDFPDDEANAIVEKYYAVLKETSGVQPKVYRAGGWCIQPFSQVAATMKKLGILVDSTVFPGGKFSSEHYSFDFSAIPLFSDAYRFNDDECIPDKNGDFLEVPIASWRYDPLFYWQLYGWGRIAPSRHKMVGDGLFLAQPGRKKSVLTSFTDNHVSSDGYYAKLLQRQAKAYERKNVEHFVVIGHPKSMTKFSMRKLEQFIAGNRARYQFTRLPE